MHARGRHFARIQSPPRSHHAEESTTASRVRRRGRERDWLAAVVVVVVFSSLCLRVNLGLLFSASRPKNRRGTPHVNEQAVIDVIDVLNVSKMRVVMVRQESIK